MGIKIKILSIVFYCFVSRLGIIFYLSLHITSGVRKPFVFTVYFFFCFTCKHKQVAFKTIEKIQIIFSQFFTGYALILRQKFFINNLINIF